MCDESYFLIITETKSIHLPRLMNVELTHENNIAVACTSFFVD